MTPMLPLLFDGMIVLLLAAAIAYLIVLNRRLGRLRALQPELSRVLAGFAEATGKAEASIAKLKAFGAEAGKLDKQERERGERARALRDDLAFLVERGSQIADRLEGSVRQARGEVPANAPRAVSVTPLGARRAEGGEPRETPSQSERALMDALRQAR